MMGHAWLKHREALLAVVIILMIGAIGSRAPSFVSPGNLVEMFNDTAILIILALGQMMVLLTKGIDLSMAANLALTGMIVALLNAHYPGIPVVALLALATLLGLLMGVINGLLVWRLGIPAIVVTLGTMSLYRGITYILLGDQALNHYPESFAWFGQGYVWGALSFEFALFILLAAAFTFLLHKTNFGRRTYAIGNNPTGAWFSGINVKRHNLVLFALVGLMAGLAAVLLTSRLGSTRPTLAMGWELAVVTMAVLGGVNILGGSGSMPGVIIAAFLMGLVTFGLSLLNVPGIVMSVIIGAMLIVVISLPIITRRMMQRRRC
ncbi:TPA: ABC transporter permease [Klebsiella pneumoniae]|nr:ABC transporter permease [Klebsiella pneumoniae]